MDYSLVRFETDHFLQQAPGSWLNPGVALGRYSITWESELVGNQFFIQRISSISLFHALKSKSNQHYPRGGHDARFTQLFKVTFALPLLKSSFGSRYGWPASSPPLSGASGAPTSSGWTRFARWPCERLVVELRQLESRPESSQIESVK